MSQPQDSTSAASSPPAEMIARLLDLSIVSRGRVVVIGLGGIGLPLTRALATFLAGLCHASPDVNNVQIVLCDGDAFNDGNAYRMDFPGCGNKAQTVGADLLQRIDIPGFQVRWVAEYVTPENITQLIREGDCVFLACDNHATRHLVGQHCAQTLHDVVLISGGNDGVEEGLRGTYGNVQVHLRRAGRDVTAPLDRFHPEIAHPPDHAPGDLSCLELIQSGVPQISFTNLAIASAMCNALLRLMMPVPGQPMYDEINLDILEAVSTPHWLSSVPGGTANDDGEAH